MLPDVRRDRTAAAAKSPPQILLLAEEELGVHDEGEILLLRISSTEVSGYTMMPHDKGEHEHHHQYPHCNGQQRTRGRLGTVWHRLPWATPRSRQEWRRNSRECSKYARQCYRSKRE